MSLTKPSLPQAKEGLVITAGAWNALAGGIEGLYDALAGAGRDYVEVSVTSRGHVIPDARVTGIAQNPPGPPGPPLAAVAPIGPLRTHALVGVHEGAWKIVVEAPGFTAQTLDLSVDQSPASGPSASLAVELVRTTVPAPNLVGLPYKVAEHLLGWADLPLGSEQVFSEPAAVPDGDEGHNGAVLMQGPVATDIARHSPLHILYDPMAAQLTPTVTVVPELIGLPASGLAARLAEFQLDIGPAGSAEPGTRVIGQDRRAGEVVATHTPLVLTYGPSVADTTTFAAFPGTHPALASVPVQRIWTALVPRAAELFNTAYGFATPWDVARVHRSDAYIKTLLDFFQGFGVPASPPPSDLESIWRSFVVATHWGVKV